MQTRPLGRSGLTVAPLAFGGNVFGWTADEKTSFDLLDRFVERGFNLIDTADVYSRWARGHQGGESETVIGKWLKKTKRRGDVLIATKVGMEMGPDAKGLSPAHIERSVEGSLKRLGTDYIDLYQSHIDDESTPLEETLSAYQRLIEAGKVRVIGASNYSAARLEEALALSERFKLPRYETLQPHYNLVERPLFEGALQSVCERHEVAVIPYFSLAAGFLTGKYRSEADLEHRARGGSVKKYLNERGLGVVKALDGVARELHSTPAAVALAWLMAQATIAAPIVSATSLEQLDAILASTNLVLNSDQLARLDQASGGA